MNDSMLRALVRTVHSILLYLIIRDPHSEVLNNTLKNINVTFGKELK